MLVRSGFLWNGPLFRVRSKPTLRPTICTELYGLPTVRIANTVLGCQDLMPAATCNCKSLIRMALICLRSGNAEVLKTFALQTGLKVEREKKRAPVAGALRLLARNWRG